MRAASQAKRPKGKRRELVREQEKLGPSMAALNEKQREFVRQLYMQRPGFGVFARACRAAGYGTASSSAASIATIACRLKSNELVLLAIAEEDKNHIRAVAPRAIHALERLIETPGHRDHMRAIATALERTNPVETTHHVKVEHRAASSFKATTEAVERILQLAVLYGVTMPNIIDVTPEAKGTS
jgi:phage terminase small subunit